MTNEQNFAGNKKKADFNLLYPLEQKLTKAVVPHIPKWLETNHLTWMTVVWSIGALAFGWLAKGNLLWIWGINAMLICQYLSDLFDGAVGRYRDTGLVKWGYFMDHFLDYIFLCALFVGYSFFIPDRYNALFFLMIVYGAYLVNSYVSFAATNQFKITYLGIGPTEGRIGFLIVNILLMYTNIHFLSRFLPHLLAIAFIGLCVIVFRSQRYIWKLDMDAKAQQKNQMSPSIL
jgi:hypothetical protein